MSFGLYRDGYVGLLIYNVDDGYLYRAIDLDYQYSGWQSCYWDGTDDWGYPVPQGMYCMQVVYYDTDPYEYIGSLWPDPNTYLPLGQAYTKSGSVSGSSLKEYRIWSPTDGKLQVKVSGTSGLVVRLGDASGKSGRVLGQTTLTGPGNWRCIEKTQTDRGGRYYYVTVRGSGTYQIYAQFFQQGTADPKPWNGWWWPTSGLTTDAHYSDPHMWSSGGGYRPLWKYDQEFGTTSRQWEQTNQSLTNGWELPGAGHCWGWTMASLLHREPVTVTTSNNVTFNQDEAKGLVSQLYDEFGIYGNTTWPGLDGGYNPPIIATTVDADPWCKRFYDVLYFGLRQAQHGLHSDMANSQTDMTPWNYPVYQYTSEFVHVPNETSAERQHLRLHTTVTRAVNSSCPPPSKTASNGHVDEEFTYELWLRAVQPANVSPVFPWDVHHYNWISSSTDVVPRSMRWLTGMNWSNPSTSPAGSYNDNMDPNVKTRVFSIAPSP